MGVWCGIYSATARVELFIFFLNMCGSLHALCHFLLPGHLQLHMKCLHDNDSVILAYFHRFFPTVTRWGEHPDKYHVYFRENVNQFQPLSSHGFWKIAFGDRGRFWWRLAVVASGLCCCGVLTAVDKQTTFNESFQDQRWRYNISIKLFTFTMTVSPVWQCRLADTQEKPLWPWIVKSKHINQTSITHKSNSLGMIQISIFFFIIHLFHQCVFPCFSRFPMQTPLRLWMVYWWQQQGCWEIRSIQMGWTYDQRSDSPRNWYI